jgi:hypothetical protein
VCYDLCDFLSGEKAMNIVAFFSGLIVLAVGLLVWIIRPNEAPGRAAVEFLGAKFRFDTPAFGAMTIGLALMLFSPRFPAVFSPVPDPIKKIVCTGASEGNCPGPHDIFYTCGNFGTDQEIAERICTKIRSGYVRLKTVSGNMCGYALIEVTCH